MSTPTAASSIDEKVQKAINLRSAALKQRAEGTGNNLQEINYYFNSKTPWIRMTSSANIGGSSTLAQKYKLGTIHKDEDPRIPSATEVDPVLGIRPKPFIESMDIVSLGRYGALRDVTVNFKCFTTQQLDDLEKLFMRPGVSVLVEWGHSLYLSGTADNIQVKPMGTGYGGMFDGTKKTLLQVERSLKILRRDYGYDYDASFGIIKNFSWSFDGKSQSYACKVIIASPGEAIGSLKSNLALPDTIAIEYKKQRKYGTTAPLQPVTSGSINYSLVDSIPDIPMEDRLPFLEERSELELSSLLRTFLFEDIINYFHRKVVEDTRIAANNSNTNYNYENSNGTLNTPTLDQPVIRTIVRDPNFYAGPVAPSNIPGPQVANPKEPTLVNITKYHAIMLTFFFKENIELDFENLKSLNNTSRRGGATQRNFKNNLRSRLVQGEIEFWQRYRAMSYIRYGDLLEFLNNFMLLSDDTAILSFDTSTSQKFRKTKVVQSIDPAVCLLPGDVDILTEGIPNTDGFVTGGDFVSIADIALNVAMLYEIAENENGGLKDYIEAINTKIASSVGGLLELDLHYFEELAQYAVVDRSRFSQTQPRELQILGTDSFVRDLQLTTTITNKLASSIATSVSSGGARSDLAKSLLNFHTNDVSDRNLPGLDVYPSKVVDPQSNVTGQITQQAVDAAVAYETLSALYDQRLYSEGLIYNAKQVFSNFIQEKSDPEELGSMLIPYNLILTLDGISGVRIMDAYMIDSQFLPTNYNTGVRVGNLVTGINQTVNNNSWTVKLTSQYYNFTKQSSDNFVPEYIGVTPTPTGPWNRLFDIDRTTLLYTSEPQPYSGPNSNIYLENLKRWVYAVGNRSIGAQTVGALKAMVDGIGGGKGHDIFLTSTFRTLEKQKELRDAYIARGRTGTPASAPGKSMHNWGAGYDFNIINTNTNKVYNTRTPDADWIALGIAGFIGQYGFQYGINYNDPIHISYGNFGSSVYQDWLTGTVTDINGSYITDSTGSVINPSIYPTGPELGVDLTSYAGSNVGYVDPAFTPVSPSTYYGAGSMPSQTTNAYQPPIVPNP